MAPLIEIRDVCCYGEDRRIVFDSANLVLNEGEKVLITAPLASGKSLLLRLIAGLSRPDKGAVLIHGIDITKLKLDELNDVRKKMGFVLHDNILISNLKVIENVALPLLYHSPLGYQEAMEKALELLDRAGFRADVWSLPGPLPLYVRKEAAIARALVLEPDIVVCENIWEGLTRSEKEHLSELLLGYHGASTKRLLVITAHGSANAAYIKPDRIIRIEGSRLKE